MKFYYSLLALITTLWVGFDLEPCDFVRFFHSSYQLLETVYTFICELVLTGDKYARK